MNQIINDIHVSVVDVPCHGLPNTLHKTSVHYCNDGLNNKLHADVFKDIQDLHLKAMTTPEKNHCANAACCEKQT